MSLNGLALQKTSALGLLALLPILSGVNLPMPELVALLIATSFAAGLNTYATVGTLGILGRYHLLVLPDGLHLLTDWCVIAVAAAMFVVEFFADKIPAFDLIWNAMQHAEHRVIFAQNTTNGRCGVDAQRLEFAQQKESEDVVEIGIGKRNAGNGGMTRSLSRMHLRRGFDLRAKVGRCAQQEPFAAILREGHLCLRARLAAELTGSHRPAIGAGAIPLRKRASGRGTENLDQHLW